MHTVGTFDAKTHLSALLDRVALGEEIVITKRGKPIARLIPEVFNEQEKIKTAINHIKKLRKGAELGDLDWKTLRDEGRR